MFFNVCASSAEQHLHVHCACIHDSGLNCFEINPYFSTTSGVKPLRSRNLNFGKGFRPSNTFPCYFQFLNSVPRQNCCLHFHLYDDEALCFKRIVWTTSFPACWLMELRGGNRTKFTQLFSAIITADDWLLKTRSLHSTNSKLLCCHSGHSNPNSRIIVLYPCKLAWCGRFLSHRRRVPFCFLTIEG